MAGATLENPRVVPAALPGMTILPRAALASSVPSLTHDQVREGKKLSFADGPSGRLVPS